MRNTTRLIALLSLAGFAALSQAQTATPRIDQREANQQARINEGVATGELTHKETRHLEKQQAKIHRAEHQAKADGVVTPAERARLTRMQNKASQSIEKDKTNGRVAG
ncbi:hypothetical protein SNE35_01410 [Paucibacter sp. R3-3]|uniref:DUF4148 domain-containing protein n=1 Tax=Roseateles agri TaxID=3098619 RepID=A0ABU5DAI3_9BURK|nr:hypothetical protein [Paucibacter sp. R3-3]MDY0743139.1 hypothetical protein [Paucibacter sp. R3-3]